MSDTPTFSPGEEMAGIVEIMRVDGCSPALEYAFYRAYERQAIAHGSPIPFVVRRAINSALVRVLRAALAKRALTQLAADAQRDGLYE